MELFIDTKKELTIAENPLLESSKILNFYFGTKKGLNIRKLKKYMRKVDLEDLIELKKLF